VGGSSRFRDAILDNLLAFTERPEWCELEVRCRDGPAAVPGLVFAALFPPLAAHGADCLQDCCLLMPDLTTKQLLVFLRCLFNTRLREIDTATATILSEMTQVLGIKQTQQAEPSFVVHQENEGEREQEVVVDEQVEAAVVEVGSNFSEADLEKKSISDLAAVDLFSLTDEVLGENFSDQEGRLVCLVCYKLLPPGQFPALRSHLATHPAPARAGVSLLLPGVGRGGPGRRKRLVSEAELELRYKDATGRLLVCDRCDKRLPVSQGAAFRKHLTYHNLKEKNYLYQCLQCPAVFTDPSNLKRHVQSIHEKQVFRCLHCDFEDVRKRRLEDHMAGAHGDRGPGPGEEEEVNQVSLDKGGGTEAIADLSASECSLSLQANSGGPDPSTALGPVLQFVYQCTGCKFRKRKLGAVEMHVRESHSGETAIRKIAVKSKEAAEQSFPCLLCTAVFRKRTLLNQHQLRVHALQLDTEFECEECGVRCANLPGLKAHTRAHLVKRFLCGSCNKSFLVLSQLKDHVDRGVCLLENRKCGVCGKVFSGKYHLQLHMRLHTNIKPFTCSICEKSFTQKRSLKEHQLTHEAERQFSCQHCEKRFVQRNHLKYHLASQHSGQAGAQQFPGHTCSVCSKVFPFPYQLRKHQRLHGSLQSLQLQCAACSQWFSSPVQLQQHQVSCSGPGPGPQHQNLTPAPVLLPLHPLQPAVLKTNTQHTVALVLDNQTS